jgi:catalase (peroxidase I)
MMLPADLCLMEDEAFRMSVGQYAWSEKKWFIDFSKAW